eukprot:7247-Heterococcus_DN1.PRE.4
MSCAITHGPMTGRRVGMWENGAQIRGGESLAGTGSLLGSVLTCCALRIQPTKIMELSVGARVRFKDSSTKVWRRADVACIDCDSVELVDAHLQEITVPKSDVKLLESFELDGSLTPELREIKDSCYFEGIEDFQANAEKLQAYGKQLFLLPDYEAALEVYTYTLSKIVPEISAGAEVIVCDRNGKHWQFADVAAEGVDTISRYAERAALTCYKQKPHTD